MDKPFSFNRAVGLPERLPGGSGWPPRHWRRWAAGVCLGAALGATAAVVLPRILKPPLLQNWIYQQVESGAISRFAGQEIREQLAARSDVRSHSVDQFLVANAGRFKDVQAGDTFIPEWKLPAGVNPLKFIATPKGRAYQQRALSVLRFEVQQLGLRQIRMGIRWSSTIEPDGQFSLAFYRPYLDFLTSYRAPGSGRRVRLLLGVGPLKSPGWPETFVPTKTPVGESATTALTPSGSLPGVGTEITPKTSGSDLVGVSKLWLSTLMWRVSRLYPSIEYFQLDNEPRNYAGPRQWIMSSAYEQQLAQIVLAYRPDASFLINWTGTANLTGSVNFNQVPSLKEAARLAQTLSKHSVIQEMLSLRRAVLAEIHRVQGGGNVVLGLDSYHLTPDIPPLPVKVEVGGRRYTIRLDTTALIEIAEQMAGDYSPWELLHSQNIPMEITELQAEPWGAYLSPGNDPKELLFEIERALQVLPQGQPVTLRFWRLDDVVYNLLYNRRKFADFAHPIVMRGAARTFQADNYVELEIVAAVSGVSTPQSVNGQQVMDNSRIDTAMDRYLVRGLGASGPRG